MNTERKINDLLLVTYLQVIGYKQSGLPELASNYIVFRFPQSPELEEHIEKFYLRQTQVDALTILEASRTVRAWATEVKRTRKGGGIYGTN
jgi:hypothetical protein